MVLGKPETIETIKAISAGTCDGTARFMEKVAFAQSDLDILTKKVKLMEVELLKIKNKINEIIRNVKN